MRRCWPLLAVLAIAGCAPAYFGELNSAAAVTGQMTYVGAVGPFNDGSNLSSGDRRFLPTKPTSALTVQSGFVLTTQGGSTNVSFLYLDTTAGTISDTGGYSFPLAGADPGYPLYDFVEPATATTTVADLLVLKLSPTDPTTSQATLLSATLPTGPMATVGPQFLNAVFGSDLILGVQVSPSQAPPDTLNFLVGTASGSAADATSTLGGAPPAVFTTQAAPSVLPVTLPGGVNRFFYGRNQAASVSYASYFSGGAWHCIQWTSTTNTPVPLGGVTNRLDAVLSTGDLLSTEGGALRLYDPNGTLLLNKPIGSLQFCYETYVGSIPYVFFSLTVRNQHGSWWFHTWAIPTADMRGLH
jgi:hypothetical protein